jgi:predicted acylesterase/phospholipase RssA
MKKFWTDASNTTLYQNWFGGIVNGLLFQGGLYDDSPLKTFIQKEFQNTQIKRDVDIGITDALKGKYQEFSSQNITSGDNLVNSLFASFAIPGFFPPAKAFGS